MEHECCPSLSCLRTSAIVVPPPWSLSCRERASLKHRTQSWLLATELTGRLVSRAPFGSALALGMSRGDSAKFKAM